MIELSKIKHVMLTAYVIKLLNKQKLYTLLDFIKESPPKLAAITNLSTAEILNIKEELVKIYGFQRINGLDYYNCRKSKLMVIQTGIKRYNNNVARCITCNNYD